MPQTPKRVPGQSNDDYNTRQDPNAQFLGTQSLVGGGDPAVLQQLVRFVADRISRLRRRNASK